MSRWLSLLLLALMSGTSSISSANDVYVDNVGGDDYLDGTAPEKPGGYVGPTRTIAKALRIAGPGDRVRLKKNDEPYHECLTLFGWQHSGIHAGSPFVIEGNGAVLDGTGKVSDRAWEHVQGDVFRFRPERITYQQLFMDGRPATRRFLEDATGKMPALEPKQWLLANANIYFRVEPDHLPMDYNLAYAQHQVGLSFYRVHDVAILDLVVQGFQQDGINAHDATRSLLLARVNCRGNGRSGIAVTNAAQADLDHCIVGDNGQAQLLLEGHSDTHVSECEIFDNTAPQFVRHGGRLTVDGKPVTE